MKKHCAFLAALALVLMLAGCSPAAAPVPEPGTASQAEGGNEDVSGDLSPMVMIDGELYYDTGRESGLDGRCGVMDGEITSAVEPSEKPSRDDESNFGTGYEYQHVAEGQIEIFMNDKWIVFERREGSGETVEYLGRQLDKAELSEETLAWLEWYNGLSEQEQLSISSVPPELIDPSPQTGDADAQS